MASQTCSQARTGDIADMALLCLSEENNWKQCGDAVRIQLAASCEHGTENEPSGSMKAEEIRDDLSCYQVPRMNSAPSKQIVQWISNFGTPRYPKIIRTFWRSLPISEKCSFAYCCRSPSCLMETARTEIPLVKPWYSVTWRAVLCSHCHPIHSW
jgi:hypothetical protein